MLDTHHSKHQEQDPWLLLNLSPPIETYFFLRTDCQQLTLLHDEGKCGETIQSSYKVNAYLLYCSDAP